MKLLLIGPFPPPHGGISVHVAEAKRHLDRAGICNRVLNLNRAAPQGDEYICVRSGIGLLRVLLAHVRNGWTLHLHTNGHNNKSWLVALACGLIGQFAPACLLTVHSGMAPTYLGRTSIWRRLLAYYACRLHGRVIAVNRQIMLSIISLGVSCDRVEVIPAYLSVSPSADLPALSEDLAKQSRPLISSVLFYRPEYGFDVLIHALSRLRHRYPDAQCLVMGSGEQQEEAERLIREEGLEKNMKLLGDVPHELCLAMISASDVFVRATRKDGDSISVREALALGVPTVVSDVGHRPPGAILFRAGDQDELVRRMETALAMPRHNSPGRNAQPFSSNEHRLLEIYSGLAV